MKRAMRIIGRKIISLLCVSALGFVLIAPAFAAENSERIMMLNKIEAAVYNMMLLNSENIQTRSDIENMIIGVEIPSYELTVNGPILKRDLRYFPILNSDDWVATAIVSYDLSGVAHVTISQFAVDTYQRFLEGEPVAILFTDCKSYLYNGDEFVLNGIYGSEKGRIALEDYSGEFTMDIERPTVWSEVTLSDAPQVMSEYPIISTLDLPSVKQQHTYSCWAAALISMFGYYGTSGVTEDAIYEAANVPKYDGGSAINAAIAVTQYGYSYGTYGSKNYYYGTNDVKLTFDAIQNEIYSLKAPIFAGMVQSGNAYGHAIAVRGYIDSSAGQSVLYMDPDDGYQFAQTSYENGTFTYVTSSGKTLQFYMGFAVYDF